MLDRRLVAVIGASGSGKSSLVRAGLVPLVRSGRLPGAAPWRAQVIVPGDDAAAALDGVAELDEPGPQLLVVDQFEEAFANQAGEALAARLVDLVLDAALDIHVVIVVRADQFAALTAIRRLAELVDDAQVIVGPPTDDELRRIIEVPARRTGCVAERSSSTSSSPTSPTTTPPSRSSRPRWPRCGSAGTATRSRRRATSRSAASPQPSNGSASEPLQHGGDAEASAR